MEEKKKSIIDSALIIAGVTAALYAAGEMAASSLLLKYGLPPI